MFTKRGRIGVLTAALALMVVFLPAGLAAGASSVQEADVWNQGGAGTYAEDAARLRRQTNGISITVSMPVPQPNTYVYPAGIETPSASPEVFSGWAFVFNYPDKCANGPGNCFGPDLFNPDVGAGVYNFAGHPAGADGDLVLNGHIQVGQAAGGPPGSTMAPLSNPAGAEVHVAIAPHGQLDAAEMPDQATSPAGSPACGCWWVAVLAP